MERRHGIMDSRILITTCYSTTMYLSKGEGPRSPTLSGAVSIEHRTARSPETLEGIDRPSAVRPGLASHVRSVVPSPALSSLSRLNAECRM
jgi:hypothetical protein